MKTFKVTGYVGCKVISAQFLCRDERDFSRQVEEWAKRNSVTEWSRDIWPA